MKYFKVAIIVCLVMIFEYFLSLNFVQSRMIRQDFISVEDILVNDVLEYRHAKTIKEIQGICSGYIEEENLLSQDKLQVILDKLVDKGLVIKITLSDGLNSRGEDIYLKFRSRIVNDAFINKVQKILINDKGDTIGRYVVPEMTPKEFHRHLNEIKNELIGIYVNKFKEEGLAEFLSEAFYQAFNIIGDSLADIRKGLIFSIKKADKLIESKKINIDELPVFWSNLENYKKILTKRNRREESKEFNALFDLIISIIGMNIDDGALNQTNKYLDIYSKAEDDFNKEILGVLICGSWARGRPLESTDEDFVIVSNVSGHETFAGDFFKRVLYQIGFNAVEVDTVDFLAMDNIKKWGKYFSPYAEFIGWQPYIIITLSPENLALIENEIDKIAK